MQSPLKAGALTVRTLARSYHVWSWEIERAVAFGWLEIITRKPPSGRSFRIVRTVSNPEAAKLPPFRPQIERPISAWHWNFTLPSMPSKGGQFMGWLDGMLHGLLPRIRERRAAASISRFLRHPNVQAAQAWNYSDRRLDSQGRSHAANRRRNLATSPRGWKLQSGRLKSLGSLSVQGRLWQDRTEKLHRQRIFRRTESL